MSTKEYYDAHRKANLSRYAKYSREWRAKNNTRAREIDKLSKDRRKNNTNYKNYKRLARCKERAAEKGLEFNITEEDIIIPEFCPALGLPLDNSHQDNRPEIDRVDNSKGYVKGNVKVISGRANRIKADATIDEIRAILKYMEAS